MNSELVDLFFDLDIRGKIIKVEDFEEAIKPAKLEIDFGEAIGLKKDYKLSQRRFIR